MRAVAKPARTRRLDDLGEGARQASLMAHERQAAQARGIGDHAGVSRQRHHHACNRGVAALVITLAHATGCQRVVTQQRIEQRRLAGARLAQDHGAAPGGHAGANLVQAEALGRRRHDHAHARTHQAANTIQIVLELVGLAAVGLGEHHHRLGIAVECQHQRARHAVEQHLAGAKRPHDQHAVHVGAEYLALAASTATPTLKARATGQHALDHAHVMPGRATHRHAVAHGRQQNLVLATRLGKPHGMLGAKRVIGSRYQRKPAVQAHHGAQLHLLGLLGLSAKIIKSSLLSFIDRQVIERWNILQRIESRHARQQLLGRCGGFGRELPTTITLSPRPRRLFLRLSLSLAHKRLPANNHTTEQVFYPQKRVGRANARPTHTLSLSLWSREVIRRPARREGFLLSDPAARSARTSEEEAPQAVGPVGRTAFRPTPSRPRA